MSVTSLEERGYAAMTSSSSGGALRILGLSLGAVLGSVLLSRAFRPSEQEAERTLDSVSQILRRPRAILQTDAPPYLIRAARKGFTPEAIAYGIVAHRSIERFADTRPEEAQAQTMSLMGSLDRILQRAPSSERPRLMRAALVRDVGTAIGLKASGPLAPSYPWLPDHIAARVALGESPKKLLSPLSVEQARELVERHRSDDPHQTFFDLEVAPAIVSEWSKLSDEDKATIYLRKRRYQVGAAPRGGGEEVGGRYFQSFSEALKSFQAKRGLAPTGTLNAKTVKVLTRGSGLDVPPRSIRLNGGEALGWIDNVVKSDERRRALVEPRTFAEDAGARFRSDYFMEISDVDKQDLAKGPKTALDDVYRSSKRRHNRGLAAEYGTKLLARPPAWWPKDPSIKFLGRASQLVDEGERMKHCLGSGYQIDDLVKGRSYFATLDSPDGSHTTIEFTPEGRVVQHYGPENSEPSQASRQHLRHLLGIE